MRELRLVPSAAAVWFCTWLIIMRFPAALTIAVFALAVVVAAWAFWKYPAARGQVLLVSTASLATTVLTKLRMNLCDPLPSFTQVSGKLITDLRPLRSRGGGWHALFAADGVPTRVPVMFKANAVESPDAIEQGSRVLLQLRVQEADRPAVCPVILRASKAEEIRPPRGGDAFANYVGSRFNDAVQNYVGKDSQGLIPGMVLGDTSTQSPEELQRYIDTGLSHLSAVSGANLAVLTTAVVMLMRMLGAGLKAQLIAAAFSVVVFVILVGTEPSVLRATVTGMVGFIAVWSSSRMEPLHALSLAIIGLILWDSDMALSYGFALSVAATIGIVAVHPWIYQLLARLLARWRIPDIMLRALAVAIAADIMTIPIIALMAGRVPTVSVLANVLAAPAVAPVTVVGLLAAVLVLIPGPYPWAAPALWIVQPFSWWISKVSIWCDQFSFSTLGLPSGWRGPLTVIIVYGWILLGLHGLVTRYGITPKPLSQGGGVGSENRRGVGNALRATRARWRRRLSNTTPRKALVSGLLIGALGMSAWELQQPSRAARSGLEVVKWQDPGNTHRILRVAQEKDIFDALDNWQAAEAPLVIVVEDASGAPSIRPTMTPHGIPVLYPHRDGVVTIYSDGTQRARDRRF